jgi:thiamine pyrophosphate-dependent acetolactate synthase large subunit-like protein
MAEVAGIKGVRIEDPAEAESKLAEALAHPGPALVDAVVNRMELAIPPKVTAEMAKGWERPSPRPNATCSACKGCCRYISARSTSR